MSMAPLFRSSLKPQLCSFVPVKDRPPFVEFGIDHLPWLRTCLGCQCLDGVDVIMYGGVRPMSMFSFKADLVLLRCEATYIAGAGWDWNEVSVKFRGHIDSTELPFIQAAGMEVAAEVKADPELTLSGNPKDVILRLLERGRARYAEFTAAISPEVQSL